MATVLDELVIQFSLDPSDFTKGQQEVLADVKKLEEQALKVGNETEASTKKLSEIFAGMKREFIGFLGLTFGGYEARRFFDFLVNLDASTSRLSRTLGINVHELSAWQSAARAMGGTGQEVVGTIMRLEQEVWNFRFGAGSNLPGALRALGGINVFDQAGNPKTGVALLREMTDAIERLPMPTAGKAAFLRMLGIDETTINLVIRGRAELEKLLAEMRKTGTTTEESAAAAERYQRALGIFENAASGLARTLVTALAPALARVFDEMSKLQWITSGEKQGAKSVLQWLRDRLSVNEADRGKWDALIGKIFGTDTPEMAAAKARLAEGLRASAAGHPLPGGGGGNWENFLSGLSYLETSQTGAPSGSSSAQGFFQFLAGTATKARAAGIADPRSGSYGQQAAATRQYIEKFYPGAASAIDRGDFRTAIEMLNKEWPSLPGGSQPQSAARYATFAQELAGGGPRPPGGTGMNVTIQNMPVYSRADDAAGIARDIKAELQRTNFTAQVPQGQQ